MAGVVFRLRPHVDDLHVGIAEAFGQPTAIDECGHVGSIGRRHGARLSAATGAVAGVLDARKYPRQALTFAACSDDNGSSRSDTGFRHRSANPCRPSVRR